jgi:hypothetical protein
MCFNYKNSQFNLENFVFGVLNPLRYEPHSCILSVSDSSGKKISDIYPFTLNKENSIEVLTNLYHKVKKCTNDLGVVSFSVHISVIV